MRISKFLKNIFGGIKSQSESDKGARMSLKKLLFEDSSIERNLISAICWYFYRFIWTASLTISRRSWWFVEDHSDLDTKDHEI